ncbi:hypothetical protein HanIR_Chr05g0226511 [Helianthus annuus]|nr:hypothetical protein HanIR_Chr05g0226511 [Helianthus annuus]
MLLLMTHDVYIAVQNPTRLKMTGSFWAGKVTGSTWLSYPYSTISARLIENLGGDTSWTDSIAF